MRFREILGAGVLAAAVSAGAAHGGGELFGTIETTSGESLTGAIHWDVHENFWDDRLDTLKTEVIEEDPGFQFKVFGVKLFGDDGTSHPSLSVPFGHLRSIENKGRSALLTLKNGDVIEARAETRDLGPHMRDLVVDDGEGKRSLEWYQVKRIDFDSGPGKGRDAERLYGIVETASGEHAGYLIWDRDESLVDDLMDGEADGEDHEIAFGEITLVERLGSRGSKVTLKDGTTLELSGTNDVDGDHRGMIVLVPGFGTLEIDWRDVTRVRFSAPPPSPVYDTFDGGYRLEGTVRTRDGAVLRGRIIWDRDESWSWETIDGDVDGIEYGLPFELVRRIEPQGDWAADVVLRDGRTLRLQGSNDVNEENRGILVLSAEETHVLAWGDVRRLDLDAPAVSPEDPKVKSPTR